MDGKFVNNITLGPLVVKDLRKVTRLPLEAHLMIDRPFKYSDAFIDAGADIITVHIEASTKSEIKKNKSRINSYGVKLGVSLNPPTPLKEILPVLDCIDMVLVMSVNPGFGGQKFMPSVLPKIKKLRSIYSGDIAVDGGVNEQNARLLIEAGANILAAGTYIFKAKDTELAIRRLKNAAI